ncbi:MAG: hypothetical protein ACT4OX_03635 [Actinomycetota bacterium]
MTGSLEEPHPNGAPTSATTSPPPNPLRRRLLLGALVVVALAWGYAIWFSVTRTPPENLSEDTRRAVGAACTDARQALRTLPDLAAEPTAGAAIALVRDENNVFEEMIIRFRDTAPAGGDAGEALEKWTDDWDAVVDARAAFADDLDADGEARLTLPAVDGGVRPITDRMDEYAEARGLDACTPNALQVEVVDSAREYPDLED